MRSNPYMAKTDEDGRFRIKHLPVGRHTFLLWHERAGYLRNMRLGADSTNDKGRLTIGIRQRDNKLPDTRLAAKVFEPD